MPKNSPADRAALFAAEYLKDRNGTHAAIRAGYAKSGAHVQATRLLKTAKVKAIIAASMARVVASAEVSVERTLKEIARIAYGDVRKLYNPDGSMKRIHELDEDGAALIAGLEVDELTAQGPGGEQQAIGFTRKMKLASKTKALDQCMAYLGMHKTVAPSGQGGMQLSINLSGGKKVR